MNSCHSSLRWSSCCGPIKIIPAFARLTGGADARFKRSVAIRGVLIAAALCAFVVLAEWVSWPSTASRSMPSIAGGLVLLIATLQTIFKKKAAPEPSSGTPTAMQLAASPVAVPIIVPPAGVAALLIFAMLEPQYPGMRQAVVACLAIIMVLDFLVMAFIDQIMRIPGLMMFLTVLGSVLVFMQMGMAVEMMLTALKSLGALAG